ncbi:glycerate kinase [Streptomyces sp. NPDC055078]
MDVQPARVLVAADKFKGSLTAVQVAARVKAGLRRELPELEVVTLPVADGGDGTVDAAVAAGFERHELSVTGPRGERVKAAYALRDGTAVVEMAEASGLRRLPAGEFAPLTATSYGSGELLSAALDADARTIVLGLGGSAGTDGGAGMLTALGARFLDADGRPVGPGGGGLRDLAVVDLSGLDPRFKDIELILASDVGNPLTGPEGAATVYGPQKGATPADVALLDAALTHYASLLDPGLADATGAGAAGGVGFGALAALGARAVPGIEVVLDVLGFPAALPGTTLVITGEGSIDEQTLHGKAPLGVAALARAQHIDVVAVCGRLSLAPEVLGRVGIRRAYTLLELEPDPARSMADAGPLLETLAAKIARDFLVREV